MISLDERIPQTYQPTAGAYAGHTYDLIIVREERTLTDGYICRHCDRQIHPHEPALNASYQHDLHSHLALLFCSDLEACLLRGAFV